jgi:hypothetical protein
MAVIMVSIGQVLVVQLVLIHIHYAFQTQNLNNVSQDSIYLVLLVINVLIIVLPVHQIQLAKVV